MALLDTPLNRSTKLFGEVLVASSSCGCVWTWPFVVVVVVVLVVVVVVVAVVSMADGAAAGSEVAADSRSFVR